MPNLSTIRKFARPTKPKLRTRVRFTIDRIRVWLGLASWYKRVYDRPRYQTCAMDGSHMKRIGKTATGAIYYCQVEHRRYHLEGIGGSRLVPANRSKR